MNTDEIPQSELMLVLPIRQILTRSWGVYYVATAVQSVCIRVHPWFPSRQLA